jgi:hypothetical protein
MLRFCVVVLFVVIVVMMVEGMLLHRCCMLGEFFAWLGSSLLGPLVCCFLVRLRLRFCAVTESNR